MEEITIQLSFQQIKSALNSGPYLDLEEDLRKSVETVVANIFIDAEEKADGIGEEIKKVQVYPKCKCFQGIETEGPGAARQAIDEYRENAEDDPRFGSILERCCLNRSAGDRVVCDIPVTGIVQVTTEQAEKLAKAYVLVEKPSNLPLDDEWERQLNKLLG